MTPHARAVALLLAATGCAGLFAQQDRFLDVLRASRYELSAADGRLSGAGATVLRSAVERAQFVLIGEDHGIAQIPDFVGAVCGILGPQNFHTMAIETGPLAAGELRRWLARPSTAGASLVEFQRRFPHAVAFYDMREENDVLCRCAQAMGSTSFRLWGIDQEFVGASKLILTRILETRPGRRAREAAERLLKENERMDAEAAAPPFPANRIFTMAVRDEDLETLKTLLQAEGSLEARSLVDSLLRTHEIYRLNSDGRGHESNRRRAMLMKSLFERNYREAERAGSEASKVLFKFGLYHMYRGFNPLNSLEVGNHAAELAEGRGTESVHIMIVAARGSQLAFTGFGRPFEPREFNQMEGKGASLPYLKPMADNLVGAGWTLFDLREIRKSIRLVSSAELRRAVLGFDFLVVIPEAKPSTQLR